LFYKGVYEQVILFEPFASSCVALALWRRWAPPTRYTLRRNTASLLKGLVGSSYFNSDICK